MNHPSLGLHQKLKREREREREREIKIKIKMGIDNIGRQW
jgi:hypothetical protein